MNPNPYLTSEPKTETHSDDFESVRKEIVGHDQCITTPYGTFPLIYLDWTASGRLYKPIEDKIQNIFGPYIANTHTETNTTGTVMTKAYHQAKRIIKEHVGASQDDVVIFSGTGMTGAINKFQRILGLKIPHSLLGHFDFKNQEKPLVLISHMEHHSNHTSWLETLADVVIIPPGADGLFSIAQFKQTLKEHAHRTLKYVSITSCSNVTGIRIPYHEVASIIHKEGGYCFVDFACSGPYVDIDMHPTSDPLAYLDAIFLSPHKFLGGPGTSGVLIFNRALYNNAIPDQPGGGTVKYTSPWDPHVYIDDIEEREDGGTPGFIQAIRTALAVKLKEKMQPQKMLQKEHAMIAYLFNELGSVEGLHILAPEHRDRLGVFSFYIESMHYNLVVKLLNDRFGIQTRGGCSCAGTYGHYLLHIDRPFSLSIKSEIEKGNIFMRPGWVRLSIHPTTTWDELKTAVKAIKELVIHRDLWSRDYEYNPNNNSYDHILHQSNTEDEVVQAGFSL